MKFDFNKFLAVLNAVGPVILSAIPGGEKIGTMIPTIVKGIGEAEQIQGASGADKKAHVLALVQDGVTAANASGHVTLDPAEVNAIASSGVDAVIGTIHVVHNVAPPAVPVATPA